MEFLVSSIFQVGESGTSQQTDFVPRFGSQSDFSKSLTSAQLLNLLVLLQDHCQLLDFPFDLY